MSTPTPTPNEVDEQIAQALAARSTQLGAYEATTVVPEYVIPAIKALITKQNQAYHAAGLRELKQHEHKTMDTRGQHRTHMVSFHHIDQAIAKEESK